MNIQKFGIKIFIDNNGGYSSKSLIPIFHKWIQNKSISDHLLIDVADYSHMVDGPGVMLIAHEGHFSLDQEGHQVGIMYMRKTDLDGDFCKRFNTILSITINTAKLLLDNNLNFITNSFRFIANDRLHAENTFENQNLYKQEIQKVLKNRFPNSKVDYEDISSGEERLAFLVKFDELTNILR